LSPSDQEAIRAYTTTLRDFIAFAGNVVALDAQSAWHDAARFMRRRSELLGILKQHQFQVIQVGVNSGRTVEEMTGIVTHCLTVCAEHMKLYQKTPGPAYNYVVKNLIPYLKTLDALAALAANEPQLTPEPPLAQVSLDTSKKSRKRNPRNLSELKALRRKVDKDKREDVSQEESVTDHVQTTYPQLISEKTIRAKRDSLIRQLSRYKDRLPKKR